ncbi:hypothetical protein Pan216_18450 [Planctomycetes bacterium Pan216]|uniref:Lactonase, 7-bladed beta-propeller n=1 Tax=Kolteria novifilia TaxID=2527975 RepID=A0A518B217_9BACT|nr:hypothetical protein Pan216_18450 [Planctomycetes bacterium Pan216]
MNRLVSLVLGTLLLLGLLGRAGAEDAETQTRLFFQDGQTQELHWADVSKDLILELGEPTTIAGFPKIDPEKQTLLQMAEGNGFLMVGVRDHDNGNHESGWVLAHTGVEHHDHGDHADWKYPATPVTWQHRLDDNQGNPAHLYRYGGVFYLANDRADGYTRLDPRDYGLDRRNQRVLGTPRFVQGGGNHITLGVANDRVGYATWIDGGGPNMGRVDVTRIKKDADSEIAYSFHLPHGGLHGVTVNEGKVFFAPSDGIYWCDVDERTEKSTEEVMPHHLSLGKDDESGKPRRTGAFTNHKQYVLFVTGKGENAELVILNARSSHPQLLLVPLAMSEENGPVTPKVVRTAQGRELAFVFHNHPAETKADDELSIIDLDPNRDRDVSDAAVVKRMKVGASDVHSHFGHHGIAFDADGRRAYFTNPGDGTITVLALNDLEEKATFPVGGKPGAIIARGGVESDH